MKSFNLFILLGIATVFSCKNPLKTHELTEHNIKRMDESYCIFTIKLDKDNGRLNPGDKICVLCGKATDCPKNTMYKIKIIENGETKRYEVFSSTQGMEKKCEWCPDEVLYGFKKTN